MFVQVFVQGEFFPVKIIVLGIGFNSLFDTRHVCGGFFNTAAGACGFCAENCTAQSARFLYFRQAYRDLQNIRFYLQLGPAPASAADRDNVFDINALPAQYRQV